MQGVLVMKGMSILTDEQVVANYVLTMKGTGRAVDKITEVEARCIDPHATLDEVKSRLTAIRKRQELPAIHGGAKPGSKKDAKIEALTDKTNRQLDIFQRIIETTDLKTIYRLVSEELERNQKWLKSQPKPEQK